jgi:hypothetical protein
MVEAIFVILPVVIILAAIVAVVLIARWQRKARRSLVKVFLTNEGNLRGRVNLRGESSGSELTFRFALNGASLPVTYTPGPSAMGAAAGPPAVAYAPAAQEAPASYTVPEPSGLPLASLVADLLMGVGYILPGSAGQSLMGAASRIRYGQAVTDRAGKVVGRVSAVAGSTAKTGQQIASKVGGGAAAAGPAGNPQTAQGVTAASGTAVTWWQTPLLEPGETLELGMTITPAGSAGTQMAGFRIVSRAAESDDAVAVVNEATVRIGGASGLGRWIPYISVIFLAIVAMASLAVVRSLLASLIGG